MGDESHDRSALVGSTAAHEREAYVVEDDVSMLLLLGDLLESGGWRVRGFRDVGSVRRALRSRLPSLLVLDEELPDGRGSDLARELRRDPRGRKVNLLFCTAADRARRASLDRLAPVVTKPIDVSALERALATAAERDGSSGPRPV